jgi:urease accessory protein
MSHSEWLISQLSDSAFPAGGFAHSGGLEAAWQHRRVSGGESLDSFIRSQLDAIANAAAPFVASAHREPDRLAELDQMSDAMLSNHVANRASRAQGQAFLLAASRVFSQSNLTAVAMHQRTERLSTHFAPILGVVCHYLEVVLVKSIRLFLFLSLRGLVSASVRLGIAGPMEGQTLQWGLTPFAESLVIPVSQRAVEDAAQTAPLLELLQGTQDRLYSRLFQS